MLLPVKYDDLKISDKKVVREEYIRLQNENCFHCGSPLSGPPPKDITSMKITPRLYPPGFFKHPVHLHHSHETGMTLGAVHNHCNAVLWEYHGE